MAPYLLFKAPLVAPYLLFKAPYLLFTAPYLLFKAASWLIMLLKASESAIESAAVHMSTWRKACSPLQELLEQVLRAPLAQNLMAIELNEFEYTAAQWLNAQHQINKENSADKHQLQNYGMQDTYFISWETQKQRKWWGVPYLGAHVQKKERVDSPLPQGDPVKTGYVSVCVCVFVRVRCV